MQSGPGNLTLASFWLLQSWGAESSPLAPPPTPSHSPPRSEPRLGLSPTGRRPSPGPYRC